MNKKDRLGNILGTASLWRCITFTSPLATPKGWRLPMVTNIIHPKIKKTMKKAKTISLRLTEQENYWLKALARQSGRTQSEVIRSLIKNGHVKERISRDTLILLRNLMGEATNLNQLARQANAYGFGMIADDCRSLAARISQIVKQIKDDRKDN